MCIHQLALANQEAKSFRWFLWKQGAAYWSEAKITVISRAESQKRVSWVFIYQLAREPGNRRAKSWPRCWCRTVSCSEPGACFQPEQCFSTTIWFLLDSNWTEIISISAHLVCDANQPAGSALWPILWRPILSALMPTTSQLPGSVRASVWNQPRNTEKVTRKMCAQAYSYI